MKQQEKVFGLGLSKTGTSSLGKALELLGIHTVHYPHDEQTHDELRTGQYRLSILEQFQAVVDISVVPFYAQLDALYPNSKFILTIRDLDAWLRSIEAHQALLTEQMEKNSAFGRFTEFVNACVYGCVGFNRERFLYVCETHLRNVQTYFGDRASDLLVLDICAGEGWERLCPFLGLPIPDAPFPRANAFSDMAGWVRQLRQVAREIAAVVPRKSQFILVDGEELRAEIDTGRQMIPFLERDGRYWGPPPEDATAIRELERLRRSGAEFLAVAWPAFWWLDHYAGLHDHLRAHYRQALKTERVVIYDLRTEAYPRESVRHLAEPQESCA